MYRCIVVTAKKNLIATILIDWKIEGYQVIKLKELLIYDDGTVEKKIRDSNIPTRL